MSDSSEDVRKLQLEIGGSFFELIEFTLTRQVGDTTIRGRYGVNVAKVREVVRLPKINPLASRIKGVAGVFELRGVPIPAVNLAVALGDAPTPPKPSQQIIVTEFSRKRAGFIVDTTHRIRRVAWDKVLPPTADSGSFMSGMTLIDGADFLFILDLERILYVLEHGSAGAPPVSLPGGASSGPESWTAPSAAAGSVAAAGPSILLVDDSQFIRNGVKQVLQRAGYSVTEANDGAEALELLERAGKGGRGGPPAFDIVVTDVEMPRMDGLSLTKRIREHPSLAEMPVLLHTSLSGKANQQAGLVVGANGYVIKNDFRTLLELLKEILGCEPPHAVSA